jgi:hypothetical protein
MVASRPKISFDQIAALVPEIMDDILYVPIRCDIRYLLLLKAVSILFLLLPSEDLHLNGQSRKPGKERHSMEINIGRTEPGDMSPTL